MLFTTVLFINSYTTVGVDDAANISFSEMFLFQRKSCFYGACLLQ